MLKGSSQFLVYSFKFFICPAVLYIQCIIRLGDFYIHGSSIFSKVITERLLSRFVSRWVLFGCRSTLSL